MSKSPNVQFSPVYSPSDFLAKLARKIPLKNGGFWTENLRASAFFRNFAVAMKMQRRLRAAAQRRPSKLALRVHLAPQLAMSKE